MSNRNGDDEKGETVMTAMILASILVLALMFFFLVAGADSRDGRDWQPRDQWDGARRGNPQG